MLSCQSCQGFAWPDFDERPLESSQKFLQPFREAHALAQVLRPVVGVCGFSRSNPATREIRQVRDFGRTEPDSPQMLFERFEGRLHHRGMKSARGVKSPTTRAFRNEPHFQFANL